MMRVDDNNHNYDKSTISVFAQKILSITPKSLAQEREREKNAFILLVFRHLKPVMCQG